MMKKQSGTAFMKKRGKGGQRRLTGRTVQKTPKCLPGFPDRHFGEKCILKEDNRRKTAYL